MVDGIERTARELGYSVLIKHSRNIPAEETECINLLLERRVMGLLISPVTGDYSETLVSCAKLMAGKVPFVLIDRFLPVLKTPYVTTDNERGGYEVTKHLIELGHRKIGFLKNLPCSSSDGREQGYRRALGEAGIPIDSHRIVSDIDYSEEACCRGVCQLFEQTGGDFTAIFAENDGMARAVYEVVRNKGLRIPNDIAVAGFDDAPFARLLIPGLTTVFQPDTEIAVQAVRLLQTLIQGQPVENTQITFQPKLIIRGSTQKTAADLSQYGIVNGRSPGRETQSRELGQV
jgi:DNA-binding LacI/PurR family transcriptional regulator